MFNLFALDDNGQDIKVEEETPVIDDFADDVYTTGNTVSCYACGRDLTQLPATWTVRQDYERVANPRRQVKAAKYFISLCTWCNYAHRVARRTLIGT